MGEQNVYDAQKHICFNIGRVMRRVYDHYEQRLTPYNLTTPQYFIFNALWIGDGISVNKLGERVFWTAQHSQVLSIGWKEMAMLSADRTLMIDGRY